MLKRFSILTFYLVLGAWLQVICGLSFKSNISMSGIAGSVNFELYADGNATMRSDLAGYKAETLTDYVIVAIPAIFG